MAKRSVDEEVAALREKQRRIFREGAKFQAPRELGEFVAKALRERAGITREEVIAHFTAIAADQKGDFPVTAWAAEEVIALLADQPPETAATPRKRRGR